MAKELSFSLAEAEYAAAPVKLERKKSMDGATSWLPTRRVRCVARHISRPTMPCSSLREDTIWLFMV